MTSETLAALNQNLDQLKQRVENRQQMLSSLGSYREFAANELIQLINYETQADLIALKSIEKLLDEETERRNAS